MSPIQFLVRASAGLDTFSSNEPNNNSNVSLELKLKNSTNPRFSLEQTKSFQEIFEIVKKAVKRILGKERAGLMLILADLPVRIGAFHGLGSNAIVMNRRLLEIVKRENKTELEINSYIFMILLHEYLHSLGCVDEQVTKRLVYDISIELFGENHPATRIANEGLASLVEKPVAHICQGDRAPKIIKEFDPSYRRYIH